MPAHEITWTSADQQANIDLSGDYAADDRTEAIAIAAAELVDQAASDHLAGILTGSIDGDTVADILSGYDLMDYDTSEVVRAATPTEAARSILAATRDGGAGVIDVDVDGVGVRVYAQA